MVLKKQLTANGNSWLLYINKSIAELMGLNKDNSKVHYTFSVDKLIVKKADRATGSETGTVKKLIKRSGGYGFNMNLTILEMMEINPETDQVEIILDDGILTITKAKE